MPRKPRIHYDGALYHVMVRGNNGEKVFTTEKEKRQYINIIREYKKRYQFKIYAYCIMDNHAHLLIEVKKVPLSKIMQGIQQVYTQRYNRNHNRTGHIFQQRYKSVLCQKDEYLFALIKYIHFNPIKANLTQTSDYKWSSHNEYIKYVRTLVDVEYVLSMLSSKKKEAINEYKKYMEIEEELKENEYGVDDDKIEEIVNGIEKEEIKQCTLEQIIKKTTAYFEIDMEEIKSRKRTKRISDAKKLVVLLAKELTEESNKSICKAVGVSESGVSKIISRQNIDIELQEAKKRIKMSICQA
ncbi:MAG: transposase [Clostridia bacterium]|nr:transposase [Clostridia bacterium]